MHGDEQKADAGVGCDIAQALEHAVAVIVWEGQLAGAGDAHEARQAALERAVRPPLGVGRRQEEIGQALDEGAVAFAELLAREAAQPVGDAAAVELVLQAAISLVVEVGHGLRPRFRQVGAAPGSSRWSRTKADLPGNHRRAAPAAASTESATPAMARSGQPLPPPRPLSRLAIVLQGSLRLATSG